MKSFARNMADAALYLPRLALFLAVLVVPVLAMPHIEGGFDSASIIESAPEKGKGVGFVLLMSLQR